MAYSIDKDIIKKMCEDGDFRQEVTRKSFYWFFNMYFPHYVKYETADFQREIFTLLEDESHQNLVFVAFRGSGKSTIVTMAYILWAILGKQEKKYAIIAGLTQRQARQLMLNIKQELENNEVLRNDLGPFREEQDEWGSLALVISNYGAKIAAASTEQSIRGMRHGAYRPDLIVCDDIEDLGSVSTLESRDKTHKWFSGDVVPAGDVKTRVIVVGNLLHEDSLIMRLKRQIEDGEYAGTFRQYPIKDDSDRSLWPGKFPDEASLKAEERKIGSYNAWMREYMLLIIPEDDQLFLSDWIARYDTLPTGEDTNFRYVIAAADLAISTKQTADYTAIVMAKVYGYGDKLKIYILPHPVNVRMNFPKQIDTMKDLSKQHNGKIKIVIESNGYQEALVQQLEKEKCPVQGIKNTGQDKRARISLSTPAVKNAVVLFPKSGCDTLIRQLVGFGVERHDDLADAFAMLVSHVTSDNSMSPREIMDSFFRLNEHLLRDNIQSRFNRRF